MDGVLTIAFAIAFICLWFWFTFTLPYRMAEARNRDGATWVAISLIGSPFLAIFLLLLFGSRARHRDDASDQS